MESVMKVFNYTIIFEKEDDGGYHVYCPALKGCHSQGDNYDEALENIKDAARVYLESLMENNENIPDEDIVIKPLKVAV